MYALQSFEEFWPHYVRLHRRRETHLFHAAGSLACLGILAAAMLMGRPALAILGPFVDYGVAQASHRVYERNRTMPWRNPLWHTRAEFRMLRLVLTGRMRSEVARAARTGAPAEVR